MDDLSGKVIRGYQLSEKIGEGGFGAVYSAHQTLVEREVAIKVILPNYANHPEFIRRFEFEAQLVARLEHPFIIPLYDYWREPNSAYLVMRLLRGGNIETLLETGGLPVATVARVLDQIASALSVAHRSGVIHRDLKPANILLDDDGNTYLADFGIAKDLAGVDFAPENGDDEPIVGSPAYISPEQIGHQPATQQSDIYSLGILLYQMLTGQHPFPLDSRLLQLLQKHLREPIPSVLELRPDLPPVVDQIIEKATAKNADDRYADVMEMSVAFWEIATGQAAPLSFADQIVRRPTVDHQAEANFQHTLVIENVPQTNPYKGLRPFQEADTADFFGREALVHQLVNHFKDSSNHFLAVVGPSGSGKSSVVNAGLIPALRQGVIHGSQHWFFTEMLPGTQPLHELESALLRVAVDAPEDLLKQLQSDERGLLEAIEQILPDDRGYLVLYIDQFEEIFTQLDNEAIRLHLLQSLHVAATEPDSRLRMIITLRADFYDRPLLYSGFGDLVRQNTEVVLPMTAEELERAVMGPAERVGLALDKRLVSAIVMDVSEQPGTLPLLQYALTELFERRTHNTITFSTYRATGGVSGALARRADEIYQSLPPDSQNATRQLFLRLVMLGEGTEDTRRRMYWPELLSLKKRYPAVEDVMNLYGQYRLLTFDIDPVNRTPTVEVAHEALIQRWQRLREWLDDSREELRLHRRLGTVAVEWNNSQQDASYLARGTRLSQFETWAQTTDLVLTQLEADYLQASINARESRAAAEAERAAREQALKERSRRILQVLVVVLLIATVGASMLTIVALRQRSQAQDARQQAETSAEQARRSEEQALANAEVAQFARRSAETNAEQARRNAERARQNAEEARSLTLATGAQLALRDDNTDLAILLALEANQLENPPPLAQRSLFEAAFAPGTRDVFIGHSTAVRTVAYSPNGDMAMSGGDDAILIFWDLETRMARHRLETHNGGIRSVTFSPDGTQAATGGADNEIALWEVETATRITRLLQHQASVEALAFSRDGKMLASGDADGLMLLWDIESGEIIQRFVGHTAAINELCFTSDGTHIISVSDDTNSIVWDVATGETVLYYERHPGRVQAVDVSNDGERVVTAGSGDNSLHIWQVDTGTQIRQLIGHGDQIYSAKFSPDGRRIVSASQDATVRVWDVASGSELARLQGHTGAIYSVDLSPDGQRAVSGSFDLTVRWWDLQNGAEVQHFLGHEDSVYDVEVSHDGRYVASGSWDNNVILWDAATGTPLHIMQGHDDWVTDVAFSFDDRFLVSGSYDQTLILWNVSTGELIRRFEGHTDKIWAVDISPDGTRLVSGSQDTTARVWNVRTGEQLRSYNRHGGWVRAIDISPDGQTVLSGSGGDMTMRWWNIETGSQLGVFRAHTDWLWSVAFSPDGQLAVSSASDGYIFLWDLEEGHVLRRYEGHTGPINDVVFSPFGLRILSGSADGTVRLWDVEEGTELRRFVGHTAGVWGVAFSPDGDMVLSASGDSSSIMWRISFLHELRQWVQDNRHIREITCFEREQYRIEPLCEPIQ